MAKQDFFYSTEAYIQEQKAQKLVLEKEVRRLQKENADLLERLAGLHGPYMTYEQCESFLRLRFDEELKEQQKEISLLVMNRIKELAGG